LRSREPAVAHVLPLAHGDVRTRLMPEATAAVFIGRADDPPPRDLAAFAGSFGLTPAETRLMEQLAGGATLEEAGDALGISRGTVKTHLNRIFSKTEVSRQADLIALVDRVVPPVQRPK
jgi:DNA-binding CsgD family transcriptional regulator